MSAASFVQTFEQLARRMAERSERLTEADAADYFVSTAQDLADKLSADGLQEMADPLARDLAAHAMRLRRNRAMLSRMAA